MHGRKRSEYKALQRDTKVAAKLASKAVAWHQLQAALLGRRAGTNDAAATEAAGDTTTTTIENTLQLIEKAVSVNPDPIWLWNYRRELLEKSSGEAVATAAAAVVWEREQGVTQLALTSNPKAYAAWHHRKWCLQQYIQKAEITTASETVQNELGLTAYFFQRDERNFHCWSYRRFVVSCCLWNANHCRQEEASPPPMGDWKRMTDDDDDEVVWMGAQIAPTTAPTIRVSHNKDQSDEQAVVTILQTEWDFTEQKIRDNFSNFSAFHYRSKLLPILLKLNWKDDWQSTIAAEFELVANAVFTEPDDQTAWWYQRFLLDFMNQQKQSTRWYDDAILQPHLEQLRELQKETSSRCKWVLIGILQCLQYNQVAECKDERCSILTMLIEVDSDRNERYMHLLHRFNDY